LESWLRASSLRAGLAQRARIVLLAADGVPVKDIVERVGVSKPTVIGWKKRYVAEGIGGLEDRPKPGRRLLREAGSLSATALGLPRHGVVYAQVFGAAFAESRAASKGRPVAASHRPPAAQCPAEHEAIRRRVRPG
jgi:hypothetical protein